MSTTSSDYIYILDQIKEEPVMANKQILAKTIPLYFYYSVQKYGISKYEIDYSSLKFKKQTEDVSVLFDFLKSLIADKTNKKERIEKFLANVKNKDTVALFDFIINKNLKIGIGAKKIEEIIDSIEMDSDDPYAKYKTHVLHAKNSSLEKAKIQYPAYIQKKYDGTRRLVYVTPEGIFARSRHGKVSELTQAVIKDILSVKKRVAKAKKLEEEETFFVLDGELLDPNVERHVSNGLANTKDISKHKDLDYIVWDLIMLDEYMDIKTLEASSFYKERFTFLSKMILKSHKKLQLAETIQVDSDADAKAKASEFIKDGEEGAIVKDLRLTYKNGKSGHMIKIKKVYDCIMRVTGITPGEGKFTGMVGSLSASSKDEKVIGTVSGLTDEERKKDEEYWVGKLIRVNFLSIVENTLQSAQLSYIFDEEEGDIEADTEESIEEILSNPLI